MHTAYHRTCQLPEEKNTKWPNNDFLVPPGHKSEREREKQQKYIGDNMFPCIHRLELD